MVHIGLNMAAVFLFVITFTPVEMADKIQRDHRSLQQRLNEMQETLDLLFEILDVKETPSSNGDIVAIKSEDQHRHQQFTIDPLSVETRKNREENQQLHKKQRLKRSAKNNSKSTQITYLIWILSLGLKNNAQKLETIDINLRQLDTKINAVANEETEVKLKVVEDRVREIQRQQYTQLNNTINALDDRVHYANCKTMKENVTLSLMKFPNEFSLPQIGRFLPSWKNAYLLCDLPLKITYGSENFSLLHLAAELDNVEAARVLIWKGMDPQTRTSTGVAPIHTAMAAKSYRVLKLLAKNNVSINIQDNNGSSPLHYAAINDYLSGANYLLQKQVDINIRDYNSRTPLHIAARYNSSQVLARLLNKTVNIEEQMMPSGHTPLMEAAFYDSVAALQLLLKYKANINAINNQGSTALHLAAQQNSFQSAVSLIDKGANIHAVDAMGRTPLHKAAEGNSLDIVQLLVNRGANSQSKDGEGKMPFELADQSGKVTEFLEKFLP